MEVRLELRKNCQKGNGKYLVSFIGYAPQENPQVMVYVVIDEPNVDNQANSKLATTMASQIMTEIFPYLGVEKSADVRQQMEKLSNSIRAVAVVIHQMTWQQSQ